jgi:hypothetical protein
VAGFAVRADGLGDQLSRLQAGPVRSALESALAEELISLEEDVRGPTKDSPGFGAEPGRVREPPGQSRLAPGLGLVPINTGRLVASFEVVHSGTSAVMTSDAQDPRSGFFYTEEAHWSGGDSGEAVELVDARWEQMGARVADTFERMLLDHFGA